MWNGPIQSISIFHEYSLSQYQCYCELNWQTDIHQVSPVSYYMSCCDLLWYTLMSVAIEVCLPIYLFMSIILHCESRPKASKVVTGILPPGIMGCWRRRVCWTINIRSTGVNMNLTWLGGNQKLYIWIKAKYRHEQKCKDYIHPCSSGHSVDLNAVGMYSEWRAEIDSESRGWVGLVSNG